MELRSISTACARVAQVESGASERRAALCSCSIRLHCDRRRFAVVRLCDLILGLDDHPGVVLGVGRDVVVGGLERQGGGLVVDLKLGDEIGEAACDLFDDLANAPAVALQKFQSYRRRGVSFLDRLFLLC